MSASAPPPPAELWVVCNARGGPYDFSRGMNQQSGWKDHAAFMNALVDDGFVLLGGPLQGDREALLICSAPSEDAVRKRLAEDPWAPIGMLAVKSIERWTIVLSPPAVDDFLANVPRASTDVYASAAEL